MTADQWKQLGACRHVDPNLMFPGQGEPTHRAKAVCTGCPVTAECLDYALTNYEKFGIWGGKTESERRKLRPNRRYIDTFRIDRTPKPWCERTRWSYVKGCRCEPCTRAENDYHQAYRAEIAAREKHRAAS